MIHTPALRHFKLVVPDSKKLGQNIAEQLFVDAPPLASSFVSSSSCASYPSSSSAPKEKVRRRRPLFLHVNTLVPNNASNAGTAIAFIRVPVSDASDPRWGRYWVFPSRLGRPRRTEHECLTSRSGSVRVQIRHNIRIRNTFNQLHLPVCLLELARHGHAPPTPKRSGSWTTGCTTNPSGAASYQCWSSRRRRSTGLTFGTLRSIRGWSSLGS